MSEQQQVRRQRLGAPRWASGVGMLRSGAPSAPNRGVWLGWARLGKAGLGWVVTHTGAGQGRCGRLRTPCADSSRAARPRTVLAALARSRLPPRHRALIDTVGERSLASPAWVRGGRAQVGVRCRGPRSRLQTARRRRHSQPIILQLPIACHPCAKARAAVLRPSSPAARPHGEALAYSPSGITTARYAACCCRVPAARGDGGGAPARPQRGSKLPESQPHRPRAATPPGCLPPCVHRREVPTASPRRRQTARWMSGAASSGASRRRPTRCRRARRRAGAAAGGHARSAPAPPRARTAPRPPSPRRWRAPCRRAGGPSRSGTCLATRRGRYPTDPTATWRATTTTSTEVGGAGLCGGG
jgi:hypothetical protein